MLRSCVYFADNGSFDGEEMPGPPHDPGVDPDDDDQDMADAEHAHDEDEAGAAEKHAPAHYGAPVPPFSRHGRPETRYRMELANQLCALIVDAGIRPAHYREIQADDRLLWMWRGMPHDMYGLMRHVRATTVVMRLRRTVCSYRRS